MKENYYGFNFKPISREVIPFKGILEESDIIYNPFKRELLWYNNEFRLITNDAYDYLSNEDIYSNWKKYDAKND